MPRHAKMLRHTPLALSGATLPATARGGRRMPDIVLAHDYLLQFGGAERVVAHWAAGFDARTVVTLAHSPESTFEDFGRLDVRASLPSPFRGQVERMLPSLPSIAARTTVSGGDIALVSSSGWAHRFKFEMPHVVYVHSPARWLYAADDYRLRLNLFRRVGLAMSAPLLRSGDLEAMRRAHALVANSIVTRDRIRSAYGLDSVVVSPPVERVSALADTAGAIAARAVRRRGRASARLQERAARGRRGVRGGPADRRRRRRLRDVRRPLVGRARARPPHRRRAELGVPPRRRRPRRRSRGFRPHRDRSRTRGNPRRHHRRGGYLETVSPG